MRLVFIESNDPIIKQTAQEMRIFLGQDLCQNEVPKGESGCNAIIHKIKSIKSVKLHNMRFSFEKVTYKNKSN